MGELFVRLGFKIEGAKDLAAVERGVTRATGSVTKLAIEVGALSAAFFYMIETSMKAAVAMRSFALETGLSTDEQQDWEHRAQVSGLAAGTLTDAIKALQTSQKEFANGVPQAVGVWGMLGVDPTQGNPFQVLERLRHNVLALRDAGQARFLLDQVGLSQLLPLLRSTNTEWEKWSKNFIVTQQQIQRLAALNAAWQSLKMSLESLKTQFSSIFTPVLEVLAKTLQLVADKAAGFVRWLGGASPAAQLLRFWLQILAVDLIALGVILAGLVAVLGTLTAVMGAMTAFVWANIAVWGPWALLIGAIIISVAGLVLLFQDLWTNVRGGKSAFNWLDNASWQVRALALGLKNILSLWKELKSLGGLTNGGIGFNPELLSHLVPSSFLGNNRDATKQENNTEININEAVSARATGREVLRAQQELHRGALNQAPVPSY